MIFTPKTIQRLGRVGDESAESYPSRPAPRRVRVTSRSTQLRGDRLGRESVDSAESVVTRPSRPSRLRFSTESARNVYSPVTNGYKEKKGKEKKETYLSLRPEDRRRCRIVAA